MKFLARIAIVLVCINAARAILIPSGGKCSSDQFYCRLKNICIPKSYVCDGDNDCDDASDEYNCVCTGNSVFECDDGQCMRTSRRCNGNRDCMDGTDENACGKTTTTTTTSTTASSRCSSGEFHCKARNTCIQKNWLCDGENDCGDASDEYNCNCNGIAVFRCGDGQCMRANKKCDNNRDCVDGSDEVGCTICSASMKAYGLDDNDVKSCYIKVNGVTYFDSLNDKTTFRGFNMATFGAGTCRVTETGHFDTCFNPSDSDKLAEFISTIPYGTHILGVTCDDATASLQPSAKTALKSIGVDVTKLGFRHKLVFHAIKGQPEKAVVRISNNGGRSLYYEEAVEAAA